MHFFTLETFFNWQNRKKIQKDMIVMDNNKQSICHTARKLKLRIKDKKKLKNNLDDCIYFERKQMRPVLITDK